MKKHLRIFLAYLCALLCCALLAGCTPDAARGAQPQNSTAPAAQQSSLVAFSSWHKTSARPVTTIFCTPVTLNTPSIFCLCTIFPENAAPRFVRKRAAPIRMRHAMHTYKPLLWARPGALYTICPRYFTDQADESGLADFVAMDASGQNRHTLSTVSDNWDFFGIGQTIPVRLLGGRIRAHLAGRWHQRPTCFAMHAQRLQLWGKWPVYGTAVCHGAVGQATPVWNTLRLACSLSRRAYTPLGIVPGGDFSAVFRQRAAGRHAVLYLTVQTAP